MKKLIALCLLITSFSAQANWELSNEQSSINFISIKKSSIGEIHVFKSLSGSLKDATASVSIDLSSVDTKIPIRNDRIKSMLFKVANFSSATATTTIDLSELENLQDGESFQKNVDLHLNLHGVTNTISSVIQVIKLTNNRVLVNTVHPIIIKAADFDLVDGIEALKNIAQLPVISTAVPVTFSLLFKKQTI
jgi:polyisoprenoid-binding protein YceI